MKYFDFSTIYTAILTSNLLLAIIAVIIRNEKVMINAGYKLITIFLGLTAIRFMLPFEVPFATSIPLPQGISRFIVNIFTPLFTVHEIKLTPFRLILIVWLIGIAIQGYRYIRTNQRIYTYIFAYGKDVSKDPIYADKMKEICGNQSSLFRIFEMPKLETPLLYGYFRPFILLPADYCCQGNELTYILKHEVMHCRHNDLFIKFLVHLLSIIYWWNPFSYLLNKQMDLALEMRIDDSVTGMSHDEISEYLHCLVHMAEYQDSILGHPMGNVISFAHSNDTVLKKRFQMLMHRGQKKNKVLNLLLICLVVCIYLCSYLLVFEAYYLTSDMSQTSFEVNQINSFIVENDDGTYSLYISNRMIETINSLEYYNDDIPVYTREEFEHVQKENLE